MDWLSTQGVSAPRCWHLQPSVTLQRVSGFGEWMDGCYNPLAILPFSFLIMHHTYRWLWTIHGHVVPPMLIWTSSPAHSPILEDALKDICLPRLVQPRRYNLPPLLSQPCPHEGRTWQPGVMNTELNAVFSLLPPHTSGIAHALISTKFITDPN